MDCLEEQIKRFLPQKRFDHSMRVAQTAERLSQHYGGDTQKAYIAGLIHDVAKYQSPETFAQLGIDMTNESLALFKQYKPIWHALMGPLFIRTQLHIDDDAILQAVYTHSTGGEALSLLQQIIYISDYIEPNRHFKDCAYIGDLATADLDKATLALALSSKYSLVNRKLPIHFLTISCENYYSKKVGILSASEIDCRIKSYLNVEL